MSPKLNEGMELGIVKDRDGNEIGTVEYKQVGNRIYFGKIVTKPNTIEVMVSGLPFPSPSMPAANLIILPNAFPPKISNLK